MAAKYSETLIKVGETIYSILGAESIDVFSDAITYGVREYKGGEQVLDTWSELSVSGNIQEMLVKSLTFSFDFDTQTPLYKEVVKGFLRFNTETSDFETSFKDNFSEDAYDERFRIKGMISRDFEKFLSVALLKHLKTKNPYAYEKVMEIVNSGKRICRKATGVYYDNVVKCCTKYFNELERALKSMPLEVFLSRLSAEPAESIFGIGENKSLPRKVLDFITEARRNALGVLVPPSNDDVISYTKLFQRIVDNEDGNNAIIMAEFLRNADAMRDSSQPAFLLTNSGLYKNLVGSFVNIFYELLLLGYKSKDLLCYLIRQSYYYGSFTFPLEEARLLSDYINMAVNNGLTYEKYPSSIRKAHAIMNNNTRALKIDADVIERFNTVIESRKFKPVVIGDYIVVAPKTHVEIVEEGNALNHCVGSYIPRVAEGETFIAFLRKKSDISKSYITLELNNKGLVVQAKKAFNADPSDEEFAIIEKFEKKVGK